MATVTIATWNINSVRLRIGLILDFLKEYRPDVLCLQEIKTREETFPLRADTRGGLVTYRGRRLQGLQRCCDAESPFLHREPGHFLVRQE